MYCLDYAERLQPDNVLSFMFHELVFLGYHSQFASYPSVFICFGFVQLCVFTKIVAATVQMPSDAVFSSVGVPRMKTVIKNQCSLPNGGSIQTSRIHEDRPSPSLRFAQLHRTSLQPKAWFP